MIDEWQITHELADLPKPVWDFLKQNGLFAMIIPKEYGGLEFSAYAHFLVEISGRSATRIHGRGTQFAAGGTAPALRYR